MIRCSSFASASVCRRRSEELGLDEISDADLQSVANAVFRNERNMANEQAKVTKQKLVQLMCET